MLTGRVTYLVAVRNKRPHCIRRILISALHRATQRVDYYQHDFVVEFSLDLSQLYGPVDFAQRCLLAYGPRESAEGWLLNLDVSRPPWATAAATVHATGGDRDLKTQLCPCLLPCPPSRYA